MTLLNPHAAGRSRPTSAGSAVTHGIKQTWAFVWRVGVPLLVAVHVDMQIGGGWGFIPAFWLPGSPPAMGTAGMLALLVAVATCVALHRQRADLLLGVLPVAFFLAAQIGFGAGWLGAVAGLAVGGAAFAVRRRQGTR